MKAITTKWVSPTATKPARIMAFDLDGNRCTVSVGAYADTDTAHHAAALELSRKMNWRSAALVGGATGSGTMAWVDVSEVAYALHELVRLFLNGQHYDTRNPYTRPQVKAGLIALQLLLRRGGDWMNAASANDPPLRHEPTVINT